MLALGTCGTFHVGAGDCGVAGENMWGLQSRRIVSRYEPHACASPLRKYSNTSAFSSPGALPAVAGEQDVGAEQLAGRGPRALHSDVERHQVTGSGRNSESDASEPRPQSLLGSGHPAGQSAPVIRFGMSTKERAPERALDSPSSGAPSPHSPTCFSQELACLSPISSPGAFRFGAAASSGAGLGFVLPGSSGGPAAAPAPSAALDSSEDFSEDYSDPEV